MRVGVRRRFARRRLTALSDPSMRSYPAVSRFETRNCARKVHTFQALQPQLIRIRPAPETRGSTQEVQRLFEAAFAAREQTCEV